MNRKPGEVFAQRAEIKRFGKARITAGLADTLKILKGTQPGNGRNLHVREMFLLARPMHQRQAVFLPQMNIQEHDVRRGFGRYPYKTIFQCRRRYGFMAFGAEPLLQEIAIVGIIVHY